MPYKDPEQNKEAKRKSQDKHREKNKMRLAALYASNREKFKQRSQDWRRANRERMLLKLHAYRRANYAKIMLIAARARAKKAGFPCTITVDDIVIPSCCPVLGISFEYGKGKWAKGSPSLDRIIPTKGYIPGNVRVISWRANNLKRDGTAEEFELIAAYIRAGG